MRSAFDYYIGASDKELAKRELLRHSDAYNFRDIIVPKGEKLLFSDFAGILSNLPRATIISIGDNLLEWFQDLSWPGVNIIETTLKQLPIEKLHRIIKKGLTCAMQENDAEWINNLHEIFDDIL